MDADDLYGLPLDRFVPERGALAKELRGGGRRDEAMAIAALRKPSAAAWAVNQLVRGERPAVADLFEAGDALRDEQAALLAGSGDGRRLRAARDAERAAVARLLDAARGLLGGEPTGPVADRVAETLHAAALDPEAREQVAAGRLTRELRHVGLGEGGFELPAPAPAKPASRPPPAKPTVAAKRPDPAAARRQREREAAERAAAARREHERAAALKAARAAATSARRAAERAARAVAAAEERRDRAAAGLEEAEAALAEARSLAVDAQAAHRRAEAALSET